MTTVRLSVGLHNAAPDVRENEDDNELVQSTNLWFDVDVEAQDVLDAIDGGLEGVSSLLESLYNDQTVFYRVWDNNGWSKGCEVICEEDKSDFTPDDAFCYCEWHVEVDWRTGAGNGRYLTILGDGFDESMASDALIDYLTERLT